MSITELFKTWWQGVIYLFGIAIILSLLAIAIEHWKIVFSVIGGFALVALVVILAILFGVPRWVKITIIILGSTYVLLNIGIYYFILLIFISIIIDYYKN